MTKTFLLIPVALLASACAKDPGEGHAKAEVAQAQKVEPTAVAVGAKSYAITPENSSVEFIGAKVTAQHEGKFPDVTGVVEIAGGKPESAKVRVEIGIASLQIEPAKLSGHLKSEDFFDVAKFPKATFESTSVVPGGSAGATHTVTGNLTLHGVTKQISFPATIAVTDQRVDAKSEFSIIRKDFGIVYPGMQDDLIKDDVLLKLKLSPTAK